MTSRRVAIVGLRFQEFDIEAGILAPLGVELRTGLPRTSEELMSIVDGADVILTGASPRFDADVIGGLRARGIVRCGVGLDSIDLEAARAAGLWVARVPDYGSEAVAFHAVALVVASLRRVAQLDAAVKRGDWGFAAFRPLRLPASSRAGVYGLGQIGRLTARHLAGLGFHVAGTDVAARDLDDGIEVLGADDLLRRSDVLTLHVPGRDDGRPIVGARELDLLPDGALVVNTSRGSVLDTEALLAALRSGKVAHAALDVFEREPPPIADFADVLDRVTLTPHMAWYTEESERALRVKSAEAAACILRGEAPPHAVVVPSGAGAARASGENG